VDTKGQKDPMAGMGIETALAFTPLSTVTAELGESPLWSAAEGAVWWVDIPGKRLHRTSLANGATRSWATPEQIGFVALTTNGVVAGMESGLFAFDPQNGQFERVWRLPDEGVRFNDATTDPAGRLWAGTIDIDNVRAAGKLYRIDPDLTVTTILTGMRIPNGLAVDAARGRLYVSDSHPDLQSVWAMDLDIRSGAAGERRVFAGFRELAGRPDGAALDMDGNYWIAGVGGGEIYVFTPEGGLAATIPTPMDGPTKLAFGDGRVFLTSKSGAGDGGKLIAAPSSVRGAPVPPFGAQPALVGGMAE
jgi:sugar lactone lactonase YvrE